MTADYIPRDSSPPHVVAIRDGAWSCTCRQVSPPNLSIADIIRSAVEHERNPEAKQ